MLWTVPMWTSSGSGFSIIVAHFSSPGRKKSSRCTASTQIPETAPKAFVHLVKLDGVHTSKAYLLRRIRFHDAETGSKLTFLTKLLDAPTICALYKSRWHVELFFKEATPSDQAFLRTLRKRGEDTNLDRSVSLCSDCNHAKKAGNRYQPLHNSSDFVGDAFREN